MKDKLGVRRYMNFLDRIWNKKNLEILRRREK